MKTRVADLNHLMQNELIWKQILVLKIVVNLVRTVANMASKMTMHHCWFNLIFLKLKLCFSPYEWYQKKFELEI